MPDQSKCRECKGVLPDISFTWISKNNIPSDNRFCSVDCLQEYCMEMD